MIDFREEGETRIRYANSERVFPVRHIQTWKRGDITAAVMSASSGPKDYVKNLVFELFQMPAPISRVTMVRANGRPLLLYQLQGKTWHDSTGRQIVAA